MSLLIKKNKESRSDEGSLGSPLNKIENNQKKIIATSNGRPPWFDENGNYKDSFIIGISGGSSSGKTTVANHIIKQFNIPWVTLVSLDSFYKPISEENLEAAHKSEYDFDHPNALDYELILKVLTRLKKGKMALIPNYCFKTHRRLNEWTKVYGASIIIVEGIMTFYNKEISDLIDMKIYIDTESDIRLSRRLIRDVNERGRSVPLILKQYVSFVKPNFDKYVSQNVSIADIVVPWNQDNFPAIELIVRNAKRELSKSNFGFRKSLLRTYDPNVILTDMNNIYSLENYPGLKASFSFILDKNTSKSQFIFYSKLIMRRLIFQTFNILIYQKYALDYIDQYNSLLNLIGFKLDNELISGISIMRSGEPFEDIVTEVFSSIRIGKILIQSNQESSEPELHYLKLPENIEKSTVIIFNDKIISGSSVLMSIRILLDHDVEETNIFIVSIIANKFGLFTIKSLCPQVNIICGMIDESSITNANTHIGSFTFSQRYYGI